jgi:DNA-binding CsgD family transcriptional regulator
MGIVQELLRARDAYDRRDWVAAYTALSDVDPAEMDPGDFAALATVAYLVGRRNDCVQAMQRAYRAHLDAGDRLSAVRCAFWLARALITSGEAAVGSGWAARVQRLLDEEPDDTVERGYLRSLDLLRHVIAGEFELAPAAAADVEAYGRRFHDPDLVAFGLGAQGRLLLYGGRVPEGLAMLDEAMAALAAGEVSPVFAGEVYCLMIEACQEISDLGRAGEWTTALTTWCDAQHGLVAYTGQCALHRGQIMRLHGAYDEALEEFDRAVQRYVQAGTEMAVGLTFKERGDVLRIRGDLSAAEAAYEKAIEFGQDPQPGLAHVWLDRGRVDAAVATARRLLAEPRNPVHRSQLLPGLTEIFLTAGAIDEAAQVSAELSETATAFGGATLRAMAAYATAGVALAQGDAARAVPELRQAVRIWNDLDAPYEAARCRARLGRVLQTLDDARSAHGELTAARRAFNELGAAPAEWEVARLLEPTAPGGLSPREVEVLRLVAAGQSNHQIAESLVLSEKTVARHLSNIFTKLDVSSRTAAAAFAFEHDLL